LAFPESMETIIGMLPPVLSEPEVNLSILHYS
jgi:hypothetical protein